MGGCHKELPSKPKHKTARYSGTIIMYAEKLSLNNSNGYIYGLSSTYIFVSTFQKILLSQSQCSYYDIISALFLFLFLFLNAWSYLVPASIGAK